MRGGAANGEWGTHLNFPRSPCLGRPGLQAAPPRADSVFFQMLGFSVILAASQRDFSSYYAGGFPLEAPLGTRGVCRKRKHGNLGV